MGQLAFTLRPEAVVRRRDIARGWQTLFGRVENSEALPHVNRYDRWPGCWPVRLPFGEFSHLDKVARQLNKRPHKNLSFETPAERSNACVAS